MVFLMKFTDRPSSQDVNQTDPSLKYRTFDIVFNYSLINFICAQKETLVVDLGIIHMQLEITGYPGRTFQDVGHYLANCYSISINVLPNVAR